MPHVFQEDNPDNDLTEESTVHAWNYDSLWKPVSKSVTISTSEFDKVQEISFHKDVGRLFPRVFDRVQQTGIFEKETPDENGSLYDDSSIIVYECVGVHTAQMKEPQTLRVSSQFKGAPWQDGVQVVTDNPAKGRRKRTPRRTYSYSCDFECDAFRFLALLHLIFYFNGHLWILVEYLDGQKDRHGRGCARWQNPVIPNWPSLRVSNQPNLLSCLYPCSLTVPFPKFDHTDNYKAKHQHTKSTS